MRRLRTLRGARLAAVVVLACALSACGGARTAASSEAPLDVFLLVGQSNMAGRGPLGDDDPAPMPGVYALTADGGWALARDPLHFDKPRVVGVGPGVSFGQALHAARPGRTVGLVPGAVGGTSILAWTPGASDEATDTHPYDDAIARTHAVLEAHGGHLAGVLWHQGESDGSQMTAAEYAEHLDALVARLRAEFGEPDLPFVAAQLAPYYIAGHPAAAAINEAVAGLPDRVRHTAFVTAEGLTDKGDGTHLDAASARTLGRRYAVAMQRLLDRS